MGYVVRVAHQMLLLFSGQSTLGDGLKWPQRSAEVIKWKVIRKSALKYRRLVHTYWLENIRKHDNGKWNTTGLTPTIDLNWSVLLFTFTLIDLDVSEGASSDWSVPLWRKRYALCSTSLQLRFPVRSRSRAAVQTASEGVLSPVSSRCFGVYITINFRVVTAYGRRKQQRQQSIK